MKTKIAKSALLQWENYFSQNCKISDTGKNEKPNETANQLDELHPSTLQAVHNTAKNAYQPSRFKMEKISGVMHPRARQAVHNNAKIAYKTSTHKIARSARVLWEN